MLETENWCVVLGLSGSSLHEGYDTGKQGGGYPHCNLLKLSCFMTGLYIYNTSYIHQVYFIDDDAYIY